jgi:hypothetical protein
MCYTIIGLKRKSYRIIHTIISLMKFLELHKAYVLTMDMYITHKYEKPTHQMNSNGCPGVGRQEEWD